MFRLYVLVGVFLFILGLDFFIVAHEENARAAFLGNSAVADSFSSGGKTAETAFSWLTAIGRFHLLFLHFPIALTVMTVLAELLWIWFANPLFSHAARFMLLAAATFALPTALLGWALGSGQHFEGVGLELYVWHRYFGFTTAGLAIVAAYLRERCVHEKTSSVMGYYLCLLLLFISVSLTGAFGGSLAFGFDAW